MRAIAVIVFTSIALSAVAFAVGDLWSWLVDSARVGDTALHGHLGRI